MMVTLSVAGSGSWGVEDGWPWFRIRSGKLHAMDRVAAIDDITLNSGCAYGSNSKGRLLLEKCLMSRGDWKKHLSVDLLDQKDGVISFELWVGEACSTDFLHFVMGWSVDLTQWIQSGATNRWYEIGRTNTRDRGGTSNREYCESTAELQRSGAYVLVSIAGVEDSVVEMSLTKEPHTHKSTFHFVLPHRSFARSGKLRAIRVGQVVHELRTDALQDLLPLTLYGESNARRGQRSSSNRPVDPTDGMTKALVLLQLSCQYANYCVNELDRYSDKLDRRCIKLNNRIHRMKHHRNLLKEQRANLRREAEVLACSLDGTQSLLQELDPETHVRLQEDENSDLQEIST